MRSLRSQIGIVQQEPVLFDRSIRDNILYGIEEPGKISQEEVEEACRNSNIHHVISSLPNVSLFIVLFFITSEKSRTFLF